MEHLPCYRRWNMFRHDVRGARLFHWGKEMRWLGVAAICLAADICSLSGYAASTLDTLHVFNQTNGYGPQSTLLLDSADALDGTTDYGGKHTANCPQVTYTTSPGSPTYTVPAGCGLAFKLVPPAKGKTAWTEAILHDFSGGSDGILPGGGLVADKAGNLYGVTSAGGKAAGYCPGKANGRSQAGCGVVYKLTPPAAGKTAWTEAVLFRFAGADGAIPFGSLILDGAGNLYGTTSGGGATAKCASIATIDPAGCGVVYKLTRPAASATVWTETVLYRFVGGTDGAHPSAALVFDKAGNLYGTTRDGGGTLAACPANTAQGIFGGCGIAFKLSRPTGGKVAWTETVIRRFAGKAQPANPQGALIFDKAGNLYGTSLAGGGHTSAGSPTGEGAVFKLSSPTSGTIWDELVLHSFGASGDGDGPFAGVIADPAGNLYGTTYMGGGAGTVYELMPPMDGKGAWKEVLLYKFLGAQGYSPIGGLARGPAGNLFGTTVSGIVNAGVSYVPGTVFELDP
jgi:hypothetical protein